MRPLLVKLIVAWSILTVLGSTLACLCLWPPGESADLELLDLLLYACTAVSLGLLALGFFGFFAGAVILFVACKRGTERRLATVGLLILGAPFPIAIGVWALAAYVPTDAARARIETFEAVAERLTPVVEAIEAYEAERGELPPTLSSLVPEYLDEVPTTEHERYDEYHYTVFRSPDDEIALHYYDVGESGDAWDDGRYQHLGRWPRSILVLMVDSGEVVWVGVDRYERSGAGVPFDAERWAAVPDSRSAMVASLLEEHELAGSTITEAEVLLGPADGIGHPPPRPTPDVRWELNVPCPVGPGNWNVFVYWPTERYPDRFYGGVPERIGAWAYVHE